METKVEKACYVEKQAMNDDELALINRQSLRELGADEVFVFRIAACNDLVDRDFEHFSLKALNDMAGLFIGRTMIMDHDWSAKKQTARIYASGVEPKDGGGNQLVLRAYMLKSADTQPTIDRIEAGILREVSVAVHCGEAICDACGNNKRRRCCEHIPGKEYDGVTATVTLDNVTDVFECSFVAVPAQPAAGIIKKYGGEDVPPAPETKNAGLKELRLREVKAILNLLELEGK